MSGRFAGHGSRRQGVEQAREQIGLDNVRCKMDSDRLLLSDNGFSMLGFAFRHALPSQAYVLTSQNSLFTRVILQGPSSCKRYNDEDECFRDMTEIMQQWEARQAHLAPISCIGWCVPPASLMYRVVAFHGIWAR